MSNSIVLSAIEDPEETRLTYEMVGAGHDLDQQHDGTWMIDLVDLPPQITVEQARNLRDELNTLIRAADRLNAGYRHPDVTFQNKTMRVLPSYIAAWTDEQIIDRLAIPANEVAEYRVSGDSWTFIAFAHLMAHLEQDGITYADIEARAQELTR